MEAKRSIRRGAESGAQSDLMRILYRQYHGDRQRCIEEWAAAGERGEIKKDCKLSWLAYARHKFHWGVKLGWITRGPGAEE